MSDILTITRPAWHADFVDLNAQHSSDEERMRFVIALAMQNVERKTGGPFAAAIYDSTSGKLLAAEVNSVERLGCTLFHAETMAIAAAQSTIKPLSLPMYPKWTMVSSCEPCAMCLGAIHWAGCTELAFAALRDDAQAVGFDEGPVFEASWDYLEERGLKLKRGLCRAEALPVFTRYQELGGLVYIYPPRS